MKKILSLLLSITMLLSITAGLDLTAYAQALTGSCGENVTYTLDTDSGLLTISGTGPMTDYSSSSSAPWYSNRSSVKTVEIEYGVTSIGKYAFEYCSSLTSITIPDSVTSIGEDAFYYCSSLISVTIPNSVTSIGEEAFSYCISLTSVTIPNSVTSIGGYAFYSCNSLTNVIIGNSVTSIGDDAFYDCSSLTSVTIGNSVTSIGWFAFFGCRSLTSVTIPNSVTSIGNYAFYNCISLTSVTIPNSVIHIYIGAFKNCNSLNDVYYFGMEEEWNNISIDAADNESLTNATIHFFESSSNVESVDSKYLEFDIYNGNSDLSLKLDSVKASLSGAEQDVNKTVSYLKEDLKGKSLTFSKSGYRDYIIPSAVLNDSKYISAQTKNIYMHGDTKDGKPYVSTVFVQQLNDKDKPNTAYLELQNSSVNILEDSKYNVIISAGNVSGESTYCLSQDNAHKISNNTGVFSKYDLYAEFDFDKPIYAYVISNSKTSDTVSLNLTKKRIDETLSSIMSQSTINIFGGDSGKFTLSKNTPFLGGTSVSTDFIKVPVGVEIQGDRIRISLGFDLWEKETDGNGNWKDTEWKGFKDSCKSIRQVAKDNKKSKKKFDDYLAGKGYKTKKGRNKKKASFSSDFFGYIEGHIVDGKPVFTEVCGTVAAEFAYKVKSQFGPFGIPAFYAYIQAGAEGSAEVDAGRPMADSEVPIQFVITLGITPKLSGGAGIGLEGIMSGGAYAKAEMPVKYAIQKRNLNVGLSGEIGIEGHFIVVSGEIPLWEGDATLLNKTFGTSKMSLARYAATQYINEVNDKNEGSLKLISRDYAENTEWHGSEVKRSRLMSAKSISASQIKTDILESSVNENPQPQLITAGDTLMLVWVDDSAQRDTYNRNELVYSVYDSGIWSEPKAVCDLGTNDYMPSVYSIGDNIYVAYQNINTVLNTVDDNTVNTMTHSCEIMVAEYDKASDSFNAKCITNNNTYDYSPVITEENGKPVVYWANCTTDDYSAGSVSIMKSDFSGNTQTLYSGLNYVFELSAIGSDVYYLCDADVANENENDINIFKNAVQITDNTGDDTSSIPSSLEIGSINGKETVFYTDDNNIYYLDSSQASAPILDEFRNISGGLEIVSNSAETIAVWCEPSEKGTEFYTSSFDGSSWKAPVQLTAYDGLVSQLSAVYYNDNIYGVFTKTERTLADDGGYVNGQSDLALITTKGFSDASVSNINIDEASLEAGTESTFTVLVENKGTEEINSLSFTVSDSLSYSKTIDKDVAISAGEYDIIELSYTPSQIAPCTLSVEINDSDYDSSNNKTEISIGNCDLSLSDITIEKVEYVNVLTSILTNEGNSTAENVSTTILINDEKANETDTVTLNPGESVSVEYKLSDSDLSYDDNGVCNISFSASTTSEETLLGTNVATACFTKEIPHEHTYGDWVTTINPNCIYEGERVKICTDCGYTVTEKLSPNGVHSFSQNIVPPTYETEGYTEYTCTVCGYAYTGNYVDKLVTPTPDPTPTPAPQPTTTQPAQSQSNTPADTQQGVQSTPTTQTTQATTTTSAPATTAKKPKSTSIKKLTKGKKSFKITFKKVTGISGYEVQCATDKKFKKNKKSVTVKKSKTSTTVKKLKANKKYYVRVRTYKTVKGKKIYSSWSKVKSVKVSK